MNIKHICAILFASALLLFSSISIAEDYFLPKAKIHTTINKETGELVSVSSKNSVDNIGDNGLSISWSLYYINNPSGKTIQELNPILLWQVDNDDDASEYLKTLNNGLYSVVLTITNFDGISSSTHQYIIINDNNNHAPKLAGKITKTVLKKLIWSFQNGWVGSYTRAFISKDAYNAIMGNVIPRLNKLLYYEEIFSGQVIGAIADGLRIIGLSSSIADRVATYIVAVFW